MGIFLFSNALYSKTIVVGCTVGCNSNIKKSVQIAANKASRQINFVNLIKNPKTEFDVLISPGGGDPDPIYFTKYLSESETKKVLELNRIYSSQTEKSRARDAFEHSILTSYFTEKRFSDVPALGICYGMQMMGIVNGLPLHIDIEQELGIKARLNYINDTIDILPNSLAYNIFQKSQILGRKYHHQALNYQFYLKNLSKFRNMKISGRSNDNKIPEIIEFGNRKALGVQFHPEHEKSDSHTTSSLFDWLISNVKPK